ncbi:MAG: putative dehydrogenase [Verrucomicrobia bacterium]|jgi:predicted dehydrogenase|nr:MAG: putative dehydrogenase [Verrucomicrobiota bacterium]
MTSTPIRWGFLSTAGIARKNWQALLFSGTGTVSAVASRDQAKAAGFIADCQREAAFPTTPRPLGSYEELLADPDIQAVYIPLPTGLRKEWVIRAAQAGKHVLCEKPCALDASDLAEMIEACRQANVQFMDGVMFMHTKRLQAIRQVLDSGELGTLRRLHSQFSFNAPADFLAGNIRMSSHLEPQGCLGDLGWYTIRMTLWALGYLMPERVSGRILAAQGRPDSPDAVPMEFSAELFFPGGLTASFSNSFRTEHQQIFMASGTAGYLKLEDFVLPFFGSETSFTVTKSSFEVDGCRFNMAPGRRQISCAEYSNNHPTAQETNLFRTFNALVAGGQPDPHWPEISWKTQKVMDACLASARDQGACVSLV